MLRPRQHVLGEQDSEGAVFSRGLDGSIVDMNTKTPLKDVRVKR